MDSGDLQATNDEIAKELFPPTPDEAPDSKRRQRHEHKASPTATPRPPLRKRANRVGGFRLSFLGVVFFFFLCLLAVWFTAQLNKDWLELTWEDVSEFFSNKRLKYAEQNRSSVFYFDGELLLGCLGALPLAILVSVFTGIFTCLFMFYDSDVPGNFPPTPVSPRKLVGTDNTGWHLGYIFVPVNTLAAFTLALVCLRVNMGLPLF